MNKYRYILFLLLTLVYSKAKTQISGVINSYYKVTDYVPVYNGIRVQNINGLAAGNKVLIIQMKGAVINETNAVQFGNITSLGNAGKYEFATICGFLNDTVVFEKTLLNVYNYTQSVQLVTIPVYNDVTITGTLLAQPWDPVTGTGGVIALEASGTITLNAGIDASGAGYKGGSLLNMNGNCNFFGITPVTAYYFPSTAATATANGGKKGEGIAAYINLKDYGRGKQANGGGGGNAQNTGGAGGGNFGAGGAGGIKTGGGCNVSNPGGVAGLALNTSAYSFANNRIFPGGGGGAGHENNNEGTPGGNGGGIVFIQCNELTGNGNLIRANGTQGLNPALVSPYSANAANGDGGGGAGAGGVVLLNVITYSGNVSVEARGANGSNAGFLAQCPGPGGGGGGGVIWANLPLPGNVTTNVTGGTAGIIKDSPSNPACELTTNSAASGSAGSVQTGFLILQGLDFNCGAILSIQSLKQWYGRRLVNGVELNWELEQTSFIEELRLEKKTADGTFKILKVYTNPQEGFYQYPDQTNEFPATYRLVVLTRAGKKDYSSQLFFNRRKVQRLNLYPNPVFTVLTVQIPGGSASAVSLAVYDFTGKKMLQKEIKTAGSQQVISLSLAQLAPGTYLLQLNKGDELFIGKFVKQ